MTTTADTTSRTRPRRRIASLLLAGGVVAGGVGLGACGTGSAAPAPRSQAPLARTPLSRQDAARRAAGAILAEVKLPPGLHFVTAEPAGDRRELAQASTTWADPDLVDLARFATGSGDPQAVEQWLRAHAPAGSTYAGDGYGSGENELPTWDLTLSWPAVGQLLDSRRLVVTALTLPDGNVAVRFDAQVTWLPARSGGDPVPAGVTLLTVSLSKGMNPGEPAHAATTTSDPAVIAAIRDRLDTLSVVPSGVATDCPADFGQNLKLEFFDRKGGNPVTVVNADPAGCLVVQVLQAGKPVYPPLAGYGFPGFVEAEIGWTAHA
jgi:hypothetical protein